MIDGMLSRVFLELDKVPLPIATRNGPYDIAETGLRGLSHELVLRFKANRRDHRFDRLIELFREELKSEDNQRHLDCDDWTNGVIGVAWVNEGLAAAYLATGDSFFQRKAVELNEEVIFCKRRNLWHRAKNGRIDQTINHQMWYAYSLLLVSLMMELNEESKEYRNDVSNFLENLETKIHVYESGVMHHRSLKWFDMRSWIRGSIQSKSSFAARNIDLFLKSYGYFPFVMMPMLYLRSELGGKATFFNSRKWLSMLDAVVSVPNLEVMKAENKYGIQYNLSLFELQVIGKHLGVDLVSEEELDRQLEIVCLSQGENRNLLLLKSYELLFFKAWKS